MSPAKGCIDNNHSDEHPNKLSLTYSTLPTTIPVSSAETIQKDECQKKSIDLQQIAIKCDESQPSTSSGLKHKLIEDKLKNEVNEIEFL